MWYYHLVHWLVSQNDGSSVTSSKSLVVKSVQTSSIQLANQVENK